MKIFVLFTAVFSILRLSLCKEVLLKQTAGHATTPPRGWNSYDSFCWTINEEQFLQNAEVVSQRLLPHGYEYVVVDYLWYRRLENGAGPDSLGFDVIDKWGRMVPDPKRWPSSANGKGLTEVANKVHAMGLKFGIHVMRGISTQAYNSATPIKAHNMDRAYEEFGRAYTAKDIGIPSRSCAWMQHGFMSVNTSMGAGRAFLRSLYEQYAAWGVDFVKHDCVFGDDFDLEEIKFVSEVIGSWKRDILYSLSPGTSVTPAMAKRVAGLTNMYRITGDDWDSWGDVASHFDVTRDFAAANMTGASGLLGNSWPDLDMLPLGWLTDPALHRRGENNESIFGWLLGSNRGPHRNTNLNRDEQRTQMTLWAISKSPLMFGGDVRQLDDATYNLLTNPTLLEMNSFSTNNMEFPYVAVDIDSMSEAPARQSRSLKEIGMPGADGLHLTSCKDSNQNNWSVKHINQADRICWKVSLRTNAEKPLCLYERRPVLASGEEITYKQQHDGKLHISTSDRKEFCLDASPKRKLKAREFERASFSPCSLDANQMWELNDNGTISNSFSGLCAVVQSVEAAKTEAGGSRAWIATGRNGEVYLAFFNLNAEKVKISSQLSDVDKALHGRNLTSCKTKEIWSGRDFGITTSLLSMDIERHGTALFVLNCSQ